MMNISIQGNEWQIPKGGLDPSSVRLSLQLHHGIPRTSSKLAFDSAQRLLAIGTLDGRVKLIGTDGIEGILVSNSKSRCKFLEFANNQGFIINITAENDLEVWDLEKGILAHTHRWHTDITAFAIIQGTPFMYLGEDTGDVAVLEYNKEEAKLRQMPYSISSRAACGLMAQSSPPSLIGILPFPETHHSRVLLAYSNGLLVIWGLYDATVVRIQSTLAPKNELDDGFCSTSDQEGEDKDICCLCWADAFGDLLAVGYTDGDIWLWNTTKVSQKHVLSSDPSLPSMKLQLSQAKSRSPVLSLRWCASEKESIKDTNGYLFIYGGGEFGCSETLTIYPLKTANEQIDHQNVRYLELPLEGLFEDMILLPRPGGTPVDPIPAFLVLTNQGQLHAYDTVNVKAYFSDFAIGSEPIVEGVLVNPFITEPTISVAKIAQLTRDERIAEVLSQLPHSKGNLPSVLSGGTKWPITGGSFNKSSFRNLMVGTVIITGHIDGSLNIWDATNSTVSRICSLPPSVNLKTGRSETTSASISHLEFCACNGILVAAQASGVVSIYEISSKAGDITCLHFTERETQEEVVMMDAGFQCVVILDFSGVVSSIAISKHLQHVSVGYSSGMVLLFDVQSRAIIFKHVGISDAMKPVTSLLFDPYLRASVLAESLDNSPRGDSLSKPSEYGVLYVMQDNSSLSALVYYKEAITVCGPWTDHETSRLLHLCCLGLEKIDASSPDNTEVSLEISEEFFSSYLVVCTENSTHLYGSIISKKGVTLTSLRAESFSVRCHDATSFVSEDAGAHGLILLYITGALEIRSLPDFSVVKHLSLAGMYYLDPKLSDFPMFVGGNHGVISFVDAKRELVLVSVLKNDVNLGPGDQAVSFFDKDVAAAAAAALKASTYPPQRKSQLQGFIGGVLKDLKGGVLKELKGGLLKTAKVWKDQSSGVNQPLSLLELFSSISTPEPCSSPEIPKIDDKKGVDVMEMQLNIDDINIDDEDSGLNEPEQSSEPIRTKSKGKERLSDASDDRTKLFGEDYTKPVRRSTEEIKAKYGHKTAGDAAGAAGAAGLARDKLLERQEKLEALNKRTEEMQRGAEDFASMASELAKAMERRKWWQI